MCAVDSKVGWAPPSYLKKCEDSTDSEESDDECKSCAVIHAGKLGIATGP
jgi:hypothetical protein